jgi:N-acetylneuraminic acid mutarotase
VTSDPSTGKFYIIGGLRNNNVYSNAIYEYNPTTNAVASVAALPSSLYAATAAYSNFDEKIYIFGGIKSGNVATNEIIQFDPVTRTVNGFGAMLPAARSYLASASIGVKIYLFSGNVATDAIWEFNPGFINRGITVRSERLPVPRKYATVITDGTKAYILGGFTAATQFISEVLEYNPATETAPTVAGTMPTTLGGFSAFHNGVKGYIFGGFDISIMATILEYDPSAQTVTQRPSTEVLSPPRYGTAAAHNGTRGFIFGGARGTGIGERIGDIVEYSCN